MHTGQNIVNNRWKQFVLPNIAFSTAASKCINNDEIVLIFNETLIFS